MFSCDTIKVILSENAYHQINKSVVEARNQYEVGGVLLGHQVQGCFFVVAVTLPSSRDQKSIVSFVLDGKEHSRQVLESMQCFQRKPMVLGIWHSHICDVARFSQQDRQSNKQLTESLGGALAMIVTMPLSMQDVIMNTYFVAESDKEYFCNTIVDSFNQKIPRRYLI